MQDSTSDEVEIYLCQRRGWVIRTPMRVPDSALLKMCRYAVETYTKKLAAMPDGEKKRALSANLLLLDMMRVTQEVKSDENRDKIVSA